LQTSGTPRRPSEYLTELVVATSTGEKENSVASCVLSTNCVSNGRINHWLACLWLKEACGQASADRNTNFMKKLLTLTAIAAMIAGTANAIPTLTLADNNGATKTFSDASGAFVVNTDVGNWNINLLSAAGGPPAGNGGTATHPKLDLGGYDHFNGQSSTGNVLTITFTDDNLGPISSALKHFVTGSGSSLTAVFNLLVNGVVVNTFTGFSGLKNVSVPADSGSTVALQAILTATGNDADTSFDTGVNTAPDVGMTLAMLGSGLTGLAFFARRRKTA
jgi:hypothetical protein